MSDMYRTRTMDQISEGDIGAQLKIAGWVENIRDHGGVRFLQERLNQKHTRSISQEKYTEIFHLRSQQVKKSVKMFV